MDRSGRFRGLSRRQFLGLGAGAGAGLILAGCGGGPQNNPAAQGGSGGDGGSEYDGPQVELAFWNGFTGGDGPFMRQLVERFTSEHENIQVKMNTVEWADYYQQVPAAVRSGSGPDVGIMHSDQLGTNAARGVITPLDDVSDALGLEEADFAPLVWNAGIYNEQRFGIPLDMHPLGMYYNKSLLEEAGLDPDSPPMTRDDYDSALEELKASGIQGHWVSPFPFTGTLTFESLLWQFGGDLYNGDTTQAAFDSDAGVEALTWMTDLVRNGHSPEDVGQDSEFTAFQNGNNAFMWNGIWQINALKEMDGLDWGVVPLPQIGSEQATWSGSHNFVIMNKQPLDEDKVQASRVFINWVSQQSIEWAEAGQIPARKSVRESQEFMDLPEQSALAEQVPYVNFVPAVPGIGDVQPESFDLAVNNAVLLEAEPGEALSNAAGRADSILEENREQYQA